MSDQPLSKSVVEVNGLPMAYHEVGTGDPVIFLHGNPTSSYLWRNVIPHVADRARCIAPDLIGHGDSAKLPETGPDRYRFVEHRDYLDGLFEALDLGDRITLVIHDWGSALGFDWANRHRDRVAGICYMEAIVRPFTWDEFPSAARPIFEGFRSQAGEQMIIDRNLFVEAVLPGSILRDLTEAEMEEYRRPFTESHHRRPTLTWPREIPIDGEPDDVTAIVSDYSAWLSTSSVPKLLITAEPGALLWGPLLDYCRGWPAQTEVVVPGNHFLQEDSPDEIGAAIADWLDSV